MERRSLHDEGLRQFLDANLGVASRDHWDFETLCWAAFYFHPSLALARAQWSTAKATQQVDAQRANPTLTLTPGYNSTREPGLSPWMPAIAFDFLFPTQGKRAQQQAISANEAEAARQSVFSAAWQVRSELRRALLDWNLASRRAELRRAHNATQQKLVALLQQRYTAGNAAATEVSVARLAWLRSESAITEAEGQATMARTKVAVALGLPLSALEGVTLSRPPPPQPLSREAIAATRRESLQSRADVLAALAKYRAAQSALELEIARRIPDFHLGPGYQWDQGSNKWTIGLSFELPIFHGNEAVVAQAQARREEAARQFNQVQVEVIAAIDAAIAASDAAALQLDRARQLQAEIAKQSTAVQRRLEFGGADQVEIQTAHLDRDAAEIAILEAEHAAAAAAGQLEEALQLPFPRLATLAETAPPPSRSP